MTRSVRLGRTLIGSGLVVGLVFWRLGSWTDPPVVIPAMALVAGCALVATLSLFLTIPACWALGLEELPPPLPEAVMGATAVGMAGGVVFLSVFWP